MAEDAMLQRAKKAVLYIRTQSMLHRAQGAVHATRTDKFMKMCFIKWRHYVPFSVLLSLPSN